MVRSPPSLAPQAQGPRFRVQGLARRQACQSTTISSKLKNAIDCGTGRKKGKPPTSTQQCVIGVPQTSGEASSLRLASSLWDAWGAQAVQEKGISLELCCRRPLRGRWWQRELQMIRKLPKSSSPFVPARCPNRYQRAPTLSKGCPKIVQNLLRCADICSLRTHLDQIPPTSPKSGLLLRRDRTEFGRNCPSLAKRGKGVAFETTTSRARRSRVKGGGSLEQSNSGKA